MGDVRTPARRPGRWPGWPQRVFDLVAASVGWLVLAPLLGVGGVHRYALRHLTARMEEQSDTWESGK